MDQTTKQREEEKYCDQLLKLFGSTLANKPFSAADQELVGLVIAKEIVFTGLKPIEPSTTFIDSTKKIGAHFNLGGEGARKSLIDAYLLEALSNAGNPFLTVFTQHNVEAKLENGTKLSGHLDYVTALPFEKSSVNIHQRSLAQGSVTPLKPYLAGVRVKAKEESIGEAKTQMLGGLKALSMENAGVANGVLTDGHMWQFYRVIPHVKETYFVSEEFHHGDHSGVIIAALTSWLKGEMPPSTELEE